MADTKFKKGHIVSEETRRKISEATKKAMVNPEIRKKVSESQKKRLSNPELRKRMSETNKILWENPEYRKKQSEGHKGKHPSEETLRKMSESMKGKNSYKRTEETRRRISEGHKGQHSSPKTEFKKGLVPSNKGKHPSEETRKKMSEGHKGKSPWNKGSKGIMPIPWSKGKTGVFSEETKRKMKESWKKTFLSNPEVSRKMKEHRATQIFPVKDTKIEIKIQDFLKQLNIEFISHKNMKEIEHSYQCDILIPSMNLIIECDGDYWHGNPNFFYNEDLTKRIIKQKEIDPIRTKELQEKGFKVLRLWGSEINKMNLKDFMERIKPFEDRKA
ncbi:MAG: NUMOD3 domain-containing DNA-binding protein [archaeon]